MERIEILKVLITFEYPEWTKWVCIDSHTMYKNIWALEQEPFKRGKSRFWEAIGKSEQIEFLKVNESVKFTIEEIKATAKMLLSSKYGKFCSETILGESQECWLANERLGTLQEVSQYEYPDWCKFVSVDTTEVSNGVIMSWEAEPRYFGSIGYINFDPKYKYARIGVVSNIIFEGYVFTIEEIKQFKIKHNVDLNQRMKQEDEKGDPGKYVRKVGKLEFVTTIVNEHMIALQNAHKIIDRVECGIPLWDKEMK